jgi:hypothetical protein
MNTFPVLATSRGDVAQCELSVEQMQARAPAIFASGAHQRMSARYGFIPTQSVLRGLMDAGFAAVDVRQTRCRTANPEYARHVVRLRRKVEPIRLRDAVPEVVFLNSHDGTSGYQLRIGVFRLVCANGMIVSHGAFPGHCVAHRGNVLEEVIAAALELAEQFPRLGEQVERMQRRALGWTEQLDLARAALALRYPRLDEAGMPASQLLQCRRPEDAGCDLWTVINRIQENTLRGGLVRRSARGRLVRTRGISAIRQEVRLNTGLWQAAACLLVA